MSLQKVKIEGILLSDLLAYTADVESDAQPKVLRTKFWTWSNARTL